MGSFGSFLYINDFFGDESLFGCPPSVGRLLFIHGLGSRVHTRTLEPDLVEGGAVTGGGATTPRDTKGTRGHQHIIQQTNHCTPPSSAFGSRPQAWHAVAMQCGVELLVSNSHSDRFLSGPKVRGASLPCHDGEYLKRAHGRRPSHDMMMRIGTPFLLALIVPNGRIELLLRRNQLYANRGRTKSWRVVPMDGSLDSPASLFCDYL